LTGFHEVDLRTAPLNSRKTNRASTSPA
jgi:hypothetical protein